MSNATHTPTPWKQDGPLIYQETEDGRVYVAVVACTDKSLETRNARFIVAAANAHEALVEALDSIVNAGNIDHGTYWIVDVDDINKARAALARVKGESA